MRSLCLVVALVLPGTSLVLRAPLRAGAPGSARTQLSRVASLRLQQGPLEDGFNGLMPMMTDEGNADPELVARIDDEVQALTGVGLDDLLNPSKVVNLERDRILVESELDSCTDASKREELEAKLAKLEGDLYREKRTVFRGWLKAVFIGQSLIAIVLSGIAVNNPSIDLSLRALGFWSYWLFIIPSLRARRPRGWEKKALDIAFLGSPILTIALPFVTKQPANIWAANLVLLAGSYAFGYFSGEGQGEMGAFGSVLRALDFGSGQERGMRADVREKYAARAEAERNAERAAAATSAAPGSRPDYDEQL